MRLTDEERESLRAQAEREHRSMQEVARLAILDRIHSDRRAALLREVVDEVLAEDAELLDRLSR